MDRKWIWKTVFVFLLIVFAALASITTMDKFGGGDRESATLPGAIYDLFPGINLGLDLQGGLRLIYEVEVQAAVEDKRDRIADSLVLSLKEREEVEGVKVKRGQDTTRFDLVFPSEADLQSNDAAEILKDYRQTVVLESSEGAIAHMALVEQVRYGQCYSFKYSPRPGTPAAERAHVDEAVKADRLARLQALLSRQQTEAQEAMVGREVDVLFEKPGRMPGQSVGKSDHLHAVHVDAVVEPGRIARVLVEASNSHSLAARVVGGWR